MNDTILQIKNLNVEFPVFGGIFQHEVSQVQAVNNYKHNAVNIYNIHC